MELKNLKCPNCGAQVHCENGVDIYFCSHCGCKLIEDGISDTVVAARVVSKELDQETYLEDKKLAYEKYKLDVAEKRQDKNDREIRRYFSCLLIIVLFMVSLSFFYNGGCSIKRVLGIHGEDEIRMPASSATLADEGLEAALLELKKAGFTNIICVPIKDLVVGLFKKEGDIESISVDGYESFGSGVYLPKDAAITIRYHTYKSGDD